MLIAGIDRFEKYSPLHCGILVAIVGISVTIGLYRRRFRRLELGRAKLLDVQVSWVILVIWIIEQGFEFLPNRFSVSESIPLHFCDIVGLVSAFAVRSHSRLLRAVLYYWGFVLSPTALFWPELEGGPTTVQFWVFWVPHCTIIAAATYDCLGRGFRPGWTDYLVTIGTLLLFLALVIPFDIAIDENYGYVGPKKDGPLDFLGPWPLRLIKASIGVLIALAVVTVPWWIAGMIEKSRSAARDAERPASGAAKLGTD
jgi:hypothetical integral membrane protein (TIGR02206 family)